MAVTKGLLVALAWLVAVGVIVGGAGATPHALAADTAGLRIVKEATTLSILAGERPVLRYRYAEVAKKPYADWLATPGGIQVLRDSPSDHKHHHGLMFALAVDGVNFWEEAEAAAGRQEHLGFHDLKTGLAEGIGRASFSEELQWIAPASEKPLLLERRTLDVFQSDDHGGTLIQWRCRLQTPPGQKASTITGQHYFGLGMRLLPSMDQEGRFLYAHDATGEVVADRQKLTPTRWCAYSSRADGKPVTVAIFDHPDNLRHPAKMFTMSHPFAYLSATLNAWKEPVTVEEGKPLELTYGVAAWDGAVDKAVIEKLYQCWLGLANESETKTAATAAENAAEGDADKEPPLWSFAWLSDMHIGTAKPEFIAQALQSLASVGRNQAASGGVQPGTGSTSADAARQAARFLLITGDNNFLQAAPAAAGHAESIGLRRQRYLKAFLAEHATMPYVLIPGNNWPEDFEKEFGPKQYSFDFGGLHFMLIDADRAYRGAAGQNIEGFTAFNEATWDWIERDLERNRRNPVVVALHEPVYPPTFLEARRLLALLDRYQNVFLVLQGHLHVDLEFRRGGRTYLVAPALGKTPSPAMKWIEVYRDALVVRTIAYRKDENRFQMQARRQRIEIPKALRSGLTTPAAAGFVQANYDCVPAHPLVDDPGLAKRGSELMKNAAHLLFSK
jgi:hypothetical protein